MQNKVCVLIAKPTPMEHRESASYPAENSDGESQNQAAVKAIHPKALRRSPCISEERQPRKESDHGNKKQCYAAYFMQRRQWVGSLFYTIVVPASTRKYLWCGA